MSGQEEQYNSNDINEGAPGLAVAEDNHHESRQQNNRYGHGNRMMVGMSRNIIDYMYSYGVPLNVRPISNDDYMAMDEAASILGLSLYDRNPVKNVISDDARKEITEATFVASMVAEMKINDACGIWQEDFEEGEKIGILPCNHAFKYEAIMKWLQEEKAECPVCRSQLHSKEVNVSQSMNLEDRGEASAFHMSDQEPQQESDNYRDIVRVNSIASRLAHGVAGYVGQNHARQSVSMPMNQLLQSMRIMSSSIRLREPMRAAIPSMGGAAAAHSNYAPRDVRAAPAPAHDNNGNVYNIINNYYINNNDNNDINNNNNNNVNNNDNNMNNDDNNDNDNINNINNHNNNNNDNINNIIHVDESHYDNNNNDYNFILNQEHADIEEAIRRSLE